MKTLSVLLFVGIISTKCFAQADRVKAKQDIAENAALSIKGIYDVAILKTDSAAQAGTLYGQAYYSRGTSKIRKADMRRALKGYTTCIKIMPEYSHAYYSRALGKIYLYDKSGACADLTKAKELGHGDEFGLAKQCWQ
jgi:hypothetical protein